MHDANPALPVPVGATRVYSLSFVLGFVIAAGVSLALHWLWPVEYPRVTELEREQELQGVDPMGGRMGTVGVAEVRGEKKMAEAAVEDVGGS